MAVTQATTPALPKPRPLVGHFPAYGKDPLGFMRRLADEVGGVVPIRMGPFPALAISDPAAIEEVLVTRNKDFRKSMATRRIGIVTGDGILLSEGEKWRTHRRAVQPGFHSDRIRAWADVMVGEALATVDGWRDGATIDIHGEMSALTLRIVVRTLLGSDIKPSEMETVSDALALFTDHFDSRFNGLEFFIPDFVPTPGNLRTKAAVKRIDRIVYRLIGERRARPTTDDVISMLVQARTEDDKPLSDRQIRDEVMTLFLAGHETTALALTWSLHLLGRNPHVRDRLEQELRAVLAGRRPELDDIPRLRFTEAVVNETMRLYPPAYAVSREAIVPTTIGGRQVRKRELALVSVYAAHRNSERFPEPDAFKPERWLDGLARRLPKGAYVPFSEGPRKCIGASFAMQEAILALATICSRARLKSVSDKDIATIPAVTLRPAEPIPMRVQKHH